MPDEKPYPEWPNPPKFPVEPPATDPPRKEPPPEKIEQVPELDVRVDRT